MKKILALVVSVLVAGVVQADTCIDSLGINFPSNQKNALCFKQLLPVYVPTAAATPVAGTNLVRPGLNVVPTNAANNAMFLGAATPIPGQRFIVVNNAGAAVRLKASGGVTLNGATAGGYISVANLATVECYTATTSNQVCLQPVIPTPSGP